MKMKFPPVPLSLDRIAPRSNRRRQGALRPMNSRKTFRTTALALLGLAVLAAGATDSSDVLFSGAQVRNYVLHFYDAAWDSLMQADYAAGGTTFRPARFSDGTLTLDSVGVRYKGNGTFLESRSTLKRSLKVDLGKYVNNSRLGGARILNLHNCVTDASWMNEVLSYQLYRDAGIPAPRTAYARVYLTVPGKYDHKYLGLYSLVENVDKYFAERTFGTKRGTIFKPVTPALFAYLGPDWSSYKQTYDAKTPLFDEQIQTVIGLCRLVAVDLRAVDCALARSKTTLCQLFSESRTHGICGQWRPADA